VDDPPGVQGDGNPATGTAYLSCFTGDGATASGDLVLGVVTFYAVGEGTAELRLSGTYFGDVIHTAYGNCPTDFSEPHVPCEPGTLNITD
jgi:hypothetical protein